VAALLKERLGAEVEVQEGSLGELSVWDGARCLVRRNWLGFFPIERALVSAVERALGGQK
jgi:hypothetical protein